MLQCETSLTIISQQGMQHLCCLRRLCPRIHRGAYAAVPGWMQMAMTHSVKIVFPSAYTYTCMLPLATTEQGWWQRQISRAARMCCWAGFSYVLTLVCINLIAVGLLTLGLMLLRKVGGCNCTPSLLHAMPFVSFGCALWTLSALFSYFCWQLLLSSASASCCCVLLARCHRQKVLLSALQGSYLLGCPYCQTALPNLFRGTCLFSCCHCCKPLQTIHAGDCVLLCSY